jgi:hypothetical protein
MFWTQPNCPACGFKGPNFMYMMHGSWSFDVLVQDRVSFALRIICVPNGEEALRVLEGVTESAGDRVWAEHVATIADPPLAPTERVVPISEFMGAAVKSQPTAAELPCPSCRMPLHWHFTGIS